MWIHINFWFNRPNKIHRKTYYLKSYQQIKFHSLLRKIIRISRSFIKRKFFLYEPSPHCFLALEFKKDFLAKLGGQTIVRICRNKNIKFIKEINYTFSNDETNGDYFLNCLDSFCDVSLAEKQNFPSWLKKFPLNNLKMATHIIHCCLNQITNSRPLERKFYKTMYKTYKCK